MTAANQPSKKCSCTGPCQCPTPIQDGIVLSQAEFDRQMMLHPPKPGVGMIARRARVAIVPTYAMRTNRLWAALLTRKRIAIYYGRPIPVEQVEQYSDDKEGYQALAELVMEKIAGLKAAAWAAAAG